MATILKAAVLYIVLLFILRLIPRRTDNITTPFEFVLLFLLGGIGMQSMIADDRPQEIRHAIVERNGSVSIFKQSDAEQDQGLDAMYERSRQTYDIAR
jgi:uncharacterized membrane protein YcaP (DUF421 family)